MDIWDTPISHFSHIMFSFFSNVCKSCVFLMLNAGWLFQSLHQHVLYARLRHISLRASEVSAFSYNPSPADRSDRNHNIFLKQCSHCRGSGGDSGTGRLLRRRFGRLRPSTFVRRRGTSCMLPRSRAGETVARATFFRKTL